MFTGLFDRRLLARSLLCSSLLLPQFSSILRALAAMAGPDLAVESSGVRPSGSAVSRTANVSDPHEHLVLTLPVRNVFALQVREHDGTILVRLVGFHDEEAVPETHVPPLPEVVEMNFPPYRRLPTDVGR